MTDYEIYKEAREFVHSERKGPESTTEAFAAFGKQIAQRARTDAVKECEAKILEASKDPDSPYNSLQCAKYYIWEIRALLDAEDAKKGDGENGD